MKAEALRGAMLHHAGAYQLSVAVFGGLVLREGERGLRVGYDFDYNNNNVNELCTPAA